MAKTHIYGGFFQSKSVKVHVYTFVWYNINFTVSFM